MKKIGLMIVAALAVGLAQAGWENPPAKSVTEVEKGYLWLEAEEFSDYGTWVIDTQFVGKMGSAYLLGAGARLDPRMPSGTLRDRDRRPALAGARQFRREGLALAIGRDVRARRG